MAKQTDVIASITRSGERDFQLANGNTLRVQRLSDKFYKLEIKFHSFLTGYQLVAPLTILHVDNKEIKLFPMFAMRNLVVYGLLLSALFFAYFTFTESTTQIIIRSLTPFLVLTTIQLLLMPGFWWATKRALKEITK